MRILTTLALLLASFIPALGATTWPAGTNTADQTFFGTNHFTKPTFGTDATFSGVLAANSSTTTTATASTLIATTAYLNLANSTNLPGSSITGPVNTNNMAPNLPQSAGSFLVWRTGTNAMWTTNLTWDGTTLTILSNGVPVITLNTNGGATLSGTVNSLGPLQQNGVAVLTNSTIIIQGFALGQVMTSGGIKYCSIIPNAQVASATEAPIRMLLGIQAPFTITNLTWGYQQTVANVSTNLTFRIFTNGVCAATFAPILGYTPALTNYFTNDISTFIQVLGSSWTNQFSIQLSNGPTSGNQTFAAPWWQFQIAK